MDMCSWDAIFLECLKNRISEHSRLSQERGSKKVAFWRCIFLLLQKYSVGCKHYSGPNQTRQGKFSNNILMAVLKIEIYQKGCTVEAFSLRFTVWFKTMHSYAAYILLGKRWVNGISSRPQYRKAARECDLVVGKWLLGSSDCLCTDILVEGEIIWELFPLHSLFCHQNCWPGYFFNFFKKNNMQNKKG